MQEQFTALKQKQRECSACFKNNNIKRDDFKEVSNNKIKLYDQLNAMSKQFGETDPKIQMFYDDLREK